MKMSGLIVGGIIGAAAAMYLTRSNRPMMMTNFSQASRSLSKAVEAAKNRVMDMRANSYKNQQAGGNGINPTASASVNSTNTAAPAPASMNTSAATPATNTSANLGKVL